MLKKLMCYLDFHRWSDPWSLRGKVTWAYGQSSGLYIRDCNCCYKQEMSYGAKSYYGKIEYNWQNRKYV